MRYHPKLKKAMRQIQHIMDEHDIAGSIVLHTPGFGEHYMRINPSYSAAKFEPIPGQEGQQIRMHIKEKQIGKKRAKELAEGTTNMFTIMNELLLHHTVITQHMADDLNKRYNPDSSGSGHSSIESQNN